MATSSPVYFTVKFSDDLEPQLRWLAVYLAVHKFRRQVGLLTIGVFFEPPFPPLPFFYGG